MCAIGEDFKKWYLNTINICVFFETEDNIVQDVGQVGTHTLSSGLSMSG